MKVVGFSHITINVSDLEKSIYFYCHSLKMELIHKGKTDAYLEWGTAWICLIQKHEFIKQTTSSLGVDHIAFFINEDDFWEAVKQVEEHKIKIVRGPIQRGQGWSINFLDPDQVEIELHTSNLEERMKIWKT